jgi:hypothetical protein
MGKLDEWETKFDLLWSVIYYSLFILLLIRKAQKNNGGWQLNDIYNDNITHNKGSELVPY